MKKTLLIIAAVLSASFAFSQANVSPMKITSDKNAHKPSFSKEDLFATSGVDKRSFTKATSKVLYENDFSSQAKFDELTIGWGGAHKLNGTSVDKNIGNWAWLADTTKDSYEHATTKDVAGGNPTTDKEISFYPYSYDYASLLIGDAYQDGFIMMSAWEAYEKQSWEGSAGSGEWATDDDQFNSYIEFPAFSTVPESEEEINVVIFEFTQLAIRYLSNEVAFLDYKIGDGTWDSIPINTLSNANEVLTPLYGTYKVRLPKEVLNKASVTLRLRMMVGVVALPWVVGDVKVTTGVSHEIYAPEEDYRYFYYSVPVGLNLNPIAARTIVRNFGNEPITNIDFKYELKEKDGTTYTGTSIHSEELSVYQDSLFIIGEGIEGTVAHAIPTDKEGTYSLSRTITTDNTSGKSFRTATDIKVSHDSIWSMDNGYLSYGQFFHFGIDPSNGLLALSANYTAQGYGVALEYSVSDNGTDSTYYINSVQVVADPRVTQAGAFIQAKIFIWEPEGGSLYPYDTITGVQYQIKSDDITKYTGNELAPTSNLYRTISLPLREGIKIEKGKVYWIGYTLPRASSFAVAVNVDKLSGTDKVYTMRSASETVLPGLGTTGSYGRWPYSTRTPMIRAVVSTTQVKNSIFTPEEVNFSLEAYPNPAINNININFNIEKASKNTTIEIRDIVGRLVKVVDVNSVVGENNVSLNVADLASGTYVYTLNVDGLKQSKKLIIAK